MGAIKMDTATGERYVDADNDSPAADGCTLTVGHCFHMDDGMPLRSGLIP